MKNLVRLLQKILNNSDTKPVQDMLYEYAKQKRKIREFNENSQINESKQITEAKIKEYMLPKSRRILYQAFNDKFSNVLNQIGNYSLLSYI